MLTRCIASLQIGVGDEEHSESAGVILVGGAVSEGFGIWDLGFGFDFSAGACRYVFLRG